MDINRLQEFVTLAECLNYSKAANLLYLTQPALSRHIHDLENALEARLLVRDTHNVYLTAAGKVFYEEAKDIIEHYNQALQKVRQVTSSGVGKLRIGVLSAAVRPFLLDFTASFLEKHPQVSIQYQSGTLDELMRKLDENKLDMAFVTIVNKALYKNMTYERVFTDRLLLVVPPEHPFAKRETISITELGEQPFLNFSKDDSPSNYDFHIQMFKDHNVPFKIVSEFPNMETAMLLVSLGMGLFIIPEYLKSQAEGLVCIPLEEEDCSIDINLIWKNNSDNASCELYRKDFKNYYTRKNK